MLRDIVRSGWGFGDGLGRCVARMCGRGNVRRGRRVRWPAWACVVR